MQLVGNFADITRFSSIGYHVILALGAARAVLGRIHLFNYSESTSIVLHGLHGWPSQLMAKDLQRQQHRLLLTDHSHLLPCTVEHFKVYSNAQKL